MAGAEQDQIDTNSTVHVQRPFAASQAKMNQRQHFV